MGQAQTKEEKQLIQLCDEENADISDFMSLLEQGVKLNIHDESGQHPLWIVSHYGKTDLVDLFLQYGAEVDLPTANKEGDTALITASGEGHLKTVKLLLQRGALVNYLSKDGFTALYFAGYNNRADVVRLLLQYGAQVNKGSLPGIFGASEGGSPDIVQILLDHGADVNQPAEDEFGETVLIQASAKGHLEIVKLLLQRGALVNYQRKDGNTALYFASRNNHVDVVRLLLHSGAQVNKGTASGIYGASEGGNLSIIQILLDHGADVNQPTEDKYQATPLIAASSDDKFVKVTQLLINNGANVNYQDNDGNTVLHWAVNDGCPEQVKILVQSQANLNATNKNGESPLHCAAEGGHIQVVKLLVQSHASLNVKDKYGYSPLHVAVSSAHTEVVRQLLLSQASLDVKNNAGKTPLQIAKKKKYSEIVTLLKTGVPATEPIQQPQALLPPVDDVHPQPSASTPTAEAQQQPLSTASQQTQHEPIQQPQALQPPVDDVPPQPLTFSKDMNYDQLAEWLNNHQQFVGADYQEDISKLKDAKTNGLALLMLDENELRQFGVSFGFRVTLMNIIETLKSSSQKPPDSDKQPSQDQQSLASGATLTTTPISPTAHKKISLDEIPTLDELLILKYMDKGKKRKLRIISEAKHKWKDIANLICGDIHVTIVLEKQHHGDAEECLKQIFIENLISNKPQRYNQDWHGLIELLDDINLVTLAENVKHALTCTITP